MYTIAVDAMGGDNAPDAILRGVKKALESNPNLKFILTGPKEDIQKTLQNINFS